MLFKLAPCLAVVDTDSGLRAFPAWPSKRSSGRSSKSAPGCSDSPIRRVLLVHLVAMTHALPSWRWSSGSVLPPAAVTSRTLIPRGVRATPGRPMMSNIDCVWRSPGFLIGLKRFSTVRPPARSANLVINSSWGLWSSKWEVIWEDMFKTDRLQAVHWTWWVLAKSQLLCCVGRGFPPGNNMLPKATKLKDVNSELASTCSDILIGIYV